MTLRQRHLVFAFVILFVGTAGSFCQKESSDGSGTMIAASQERAHPLDTENNVQQRFVAVHGRRSLVDGYASNGLEVWAYPFQLLSGYRVSFRTEGATSSIRGEEILRRITYAPDSITRIYLGPDFVVREEIFVPLEETVAIFTYQVQSSRTIDIEVHATPVLDLMWPAAIGGQSVAWDNALSAYVLSEPALGYTAWAGAPDWVAHDDTGNRTVGGTGESGIGFTLRPDNAGYARVFVALNPPHTSDTGALMRGLIRDRAKLEAEATTHYAELEAHALRIETPDQKVNEALAWSETSLDQAWVCNPQLGCGIVAGYGPSRMGRRPQYAWFFAGDGLVATDALVSEGEYARAREELAFVLRWQNAKNGMIWHELSQSAGFLDWVGKYPYMYPHVDITFQFLGTLERYVTASGDIAFIRERWGAIKAAYAYCRSLIDAADGLPRIPANRMAGDEQDRESDDLGLSASWVAASQSFAHLATLTDHLAEAEEAKKANSLAKATIAGRYWNSEQSFWVQGHTSAGKALPERRSSPAEALALNVFSTQQVASIRDQLASSSFQTDWGTRTVGAGSAGYDPESYAKGSVFALHTADVAQAYWFAHRPATAQQIWNSLLPWFSLDSLGHVDEVLSGNLYRPQIESVPEQTWSPAGFLNSAVHGLLGLEVDSVSRRIVFAPHLPVAWRDVSIANIRMADTSVGLSLRRVADGFILQIDNPGTSFHLEFAPEIPLGSVLSKADMNHKLVHAALHKYPQDQHASVDLDVSHGESELHLGFTEGVSMDVPSPQTLIGDPSVGLHIVSVSLEDRVLTITAEVRLDSASSIDLHTSWRVSGGQESHVREIGNNVYELTFQGRDLSAGGTSNYARATAKVSFMPAH